MKVYDYITGCVQYGLASRPILKVRGYKERGNINTPLELAMNNQIDRFNLVMDVIDRVPGLGSRAAHIKERMKESILANRAYAHQHGIDAENVTNWRWDLGSELAHDAVLPR